MKLAMWGGLAAGALILAVVSSYSRIGTGGAAQTTAQATAVDPLPQGDLQSPAATTVAKGPPPSDVADTRSLADTVRVLSADREQLLARIATLEHSFQDLTGSTKRDAPTTTAATTEPALPPDTPNPTTVAVIPAHEGAAPEAAGASGREAAPVETSQPATPAGAVRTPLNLLREIAPAEPALTKAELGIDVGGATNFDGLRTLWGSTRGSILGLSAQPEELYPVIAVRENNKTRSPELRLVVGPLANAEAATRLCAGLAAAHRYCQPVAFEGQRLALTEATAAAPAAMAAAPSSPAVDKPERTERIKRGDSASLRHPPPTPDRNPNRPGR